jgi:hypothetical protein
MKDIEFSEVSEDGEYLEIWKDDKHYSFLIEDVFERMTELPFTDLSTVSEAEDKARMEAGG